MRTIAKSPRRRLVGVAALLGLVALLLGVLAASAGAAAVTTRPLLFSFDGSGTPEGSFSSRLRWGIAVDETNGHIYVNDEGAGGAVDVFDSAGNYLSRLPASPSSCFGDTRAIAVDNSSGPAKGNIYAAGCYIPETRRVFVYSAAGSLLYTIDGKELAGEFAPFGLAVDSVGSLFIQVGPAGRPGRILKYTTTATSATAVSQINDESLSNAGTGGFALDSAGNFYVINPKGEVEKRDTTTAAVLSTYPTSNASALAVNRADGTLFVAEGPLVSEYSSAGTLVRRFAANIAGSNGMTVDESSGRLLVVDPINKQVDVYGQPEAATAPEVTLGTITPSYFEAGVAATINPQGSPGAYRFEYRVHGTQTWHTTAALQSVGEGSADVPVSANLPGLNQNTEYDLRMLGIATESGAINASLTKTFKTEAVPPPTISAPTEVTTNSATFHGTVNPQGVKAGWHFEYSADGGAHWARVPSEDQDPGTGTGDVVVSTAATGLDPNTEYLVRLVATYLGGEGGSSASSSVSFATAPEAPVLSFVSPTHVLDTSATLQAAIDPRHSQTTYYFEFGPDESYGTTLPATKDGNAGAQLGAKPVYQDISGLEPETTYHFRLVAKNQAGEVKSKDQAFTTRSSAELQWPSRGIELVNPPDKGNQALFQSPVRGGGVPSVRADGERVIWQVLAGGPDTHTGVSETLLSHFTPTGWATKSLVPPVTQQPGGGDNHYETVAVSPNLSHFLMFETSGLYEVANLITVDAEQSQNPPTVLPPGASEANTLMSDDGHLINAGKALTLYDLEGTPQEIPTPSCGYTQIPSGSSKGSWLNKDASRVFVYSAGSASCAAARGIFMIDVESGAAELISGAQSSPASFLRANPEGTEVLFSKGGDLHLWRDGVGEECLSCGSGFVIGGGVVSPDLSHVYFCGPNPPGTVGCALHVWREGQVRFIALTRQLPNGAAINYPPQTDFAGDQMIFKSVAPATADETGWDGSESQFKSNGNARTQLYHYDDDTGIVECLSCTRVPEGGVPPPTAITGTDNEPAISADGQTIAFATDAKLLPEDINGRFDVYEWHNGLLRLVTDGESEFESGLTGMPRVWGLSADGRSLFFSEGGARITGHEQDNYSNLYDARAGGHGFPVELPPAHCVEDSCQGPLNPTPDRLGAASASANGPGNESTAERKARHRKKQKRHVKRHKHAQTKRHNSSRGGSR